MSNGFPRVVDGQGDNDEGDQDSGEQESPELCATDFPELSPGIERPCKCSRCTMSVNSRNVRGPKDVKSTNCHFCAPRSHPTRSPTELAT